MYQVQLEYTRIKRFCCLGLGGEAVMSAVLAELIPSCSNGFTWSDSHGQMGNSLVEGQRIYWDRSISV